MKQTIKKNEITETVFSKVCESFGLPKPVEEFTFHPVRKWRFDYSWPMHKVALEVEGGVWSRGRHTRGNGFIEDMEKYNTATTSGWFLIRVTPQNLMKTKTIEMIKKCITNQKNGGQCSEQK